MTGILEGVFQSVLTKKCYDEYFINHNFLDATCAKLSLSKCLGIGIILGSILVKVPQILKIVRCKSAQGINFYGVCLELFAITSHTSYNFNMNFPFSAWGDSAFLAIQTAVIASLVLHYCGDTSKALAFLGCYSCILAVMLGGMVPLNILWCLQALTIPITLCAKSIQICTNYNNGCTGQLSAVTCMLLFGGSLARIYTSIQETGDRTIILTYIVSTLANSVIVFQLLYYWNVCDDKNVRSKKKRK